MRKRDIEDRLYAAECDIRLLRNRLTDAEDLIDKHTEQIDKLTDAVAATATQHQITLQSISKLEQSVMQLTESTQAVIRRWDDRTALDKQAVYKACRDCGFTQRLGMKALDRAGRIVTDTSNHRTVIVRTPRGNLRCVVIKNERR